MNLPNDTALPEINRIDGDKTDWEALSLHSKSLLGQLSKSSLDEKTFQSIRRYIDAPLTFLLKAFDYLVNKEENQTVLLTNSLSEADLYYHLLEALALPLSYEIAYPHRPVSSPRKNHIIIFPAVNYTLTAFKDFKWEEVKFLLFNYPSLIKATPNSPLEGIFKFLLQEPTPTPPAKEASPGEDPRTLLTTCQLIPLNMDFLTLPFTQPFTQPLNQSLHPISHEVSHQTDQESQESTSQQNEGEQNSSEQKQPIRLNKKEKNHHEIAFIRKNFERQYIRNLIRRESLTQVIIIVQSRQFAKQLSNYLYRARIQSRIMHQGMDEKIKQKFIDRFNYGNVSALIISLEDLSLLEESLPQVQKVIFYQHPATYLEFEEELLTIYNALSPLTTLSLADENEKAWVEDLKQACHHFIIEIARTQPAKSHSSHKKEGALLYKRRKRPARTSARTSARPPVKPQDSQPTATKDNHSSSQDTSSQESTAGRKKVRVKTVNKRRAAAPKRQSPHSHANVNPNTHPKTSEGENNHSDTPLTIVNQNRLPFGSESFEAHIAKTNRARLKKVYANQNNPSHQDYTTLFTQEVEDSSFNPLKSTKKPHNSNNRRRANRRSPNKKK